MGATKILYSEWVITGDTGKASSVYGQIAPLTQQKDRLLLQKVTRDAQWDKLLIDDATFNNLLAYARGDCSSVFRR
jgi:NADPH-dependent 7-cyano-7-deazaguanine reductase QueF-like protein